MKQDNHNANDDWQATAGCNFVTSAARVAPLPQAGLPTLGSQGVDGV